MTAAEFLKKAEIKYTPYFEVTHEVACCGYVFPMAAQYRKTENHYLMGIAGTAARQSTSGEKCFFDRCDVLDMQTAARYGQLFRSIHDSIVPANDPMHELTFVSFVICAGRTEKAARKKLQRLQDYRTYTYGWSSLRICIFDLSDETYYYNGMGKAVKECLTRDRAPEGRKKFLGIL